MEGEIKGVINSLESPEVNAGRIKRAYGYLQEQVKHVRPWTEFLARYGPMSTLRALSPSLPPPHPLLPLPKKGACTLFILLPPQPR